MELNLVTPGRYEINPEEAVELVYQLRQELYDTMQLVNQLETENDALNNERYDLLNQIARLRGYPNAEVEAEAAYK